MMKEGFYNDQLLVVIAIIAIWQLSSSRCSRGRGKSTTDELSEQPEADGPGILMYAEDYDEQVAYTQMPHETTGQCHFSVATDAYVRIIRSSAAPRTATRTTTDARTTTRSTAATPRT